MVTVLQARILLRKQIKYIINKHFVTFQLRTLKHFLITMIKNVIQVTLHPSKNIFLYLLLKISIKKSFQAD